MPQKDTKMIKESIQDDFTLINIHAPNTGEPKHINTNRHKGRS